MNLILFKAREVLRGTFYQASLMAHSCAANAQIAIGTDTQMVVRATVPIKEGEGVFVSYTDPLQTTLQRRNYLAKGYTRNFPSPPLCILT